MRLLLIISLLFANTPTITYNAMDQKPFTISGFPAGASEACTVYRSLVETIVEDGKVVPYEPKHCWFFYTKDFTSYSDDWAFINANGHEWEIHSDIFYDVIEHGGTSVKMISTDTIRVRH